MKTLRPGGALKALVFGTMASCLLPAASSCGSGGEGPRVPIQPTQTQPTAPLPDVSGSYTLTIDRASCDGATPFPEPLATRTYVATLKQYGRELRIDLAGADFANVGCPTCAVDRRNRFGGFLSGAEVTFYLNGLGVWSLWDALEPGFPDVVERLPDGFLVVSGRATTALGPQGLTGRLSGSFTIYDVLQPGGGRVRSECRSTAHRFTLVHNVE